jgi:Cellulase (glycosyl hydrolase family 5)
VGTRLPQLVVALIAAVMLFIMLPAGALAHPRTPHATVPASASPGLSVQGNQLYANGSPFVARGVQLVGLVAPSSYLWGKYIPAGQQFGLPELQAVAADHANLIRFQVSEYGLDPANPEYSPGYVTSVENGIETARSLGLYAIVSLQSEQAAGLVQSANRCPLPDAGALAAWNEIASMFGDDPGVMFELYNEPGPGATAAGWSAWLNGGTVVYGSQIGDSCTAIGMQQLIDQIRADGAGNVIVVPALGGETNLAGMPALTDPTDPSDPQLAYGIHYPNLTTGITAWDKAFGNFSAKAPVIVTEWDGAAITPGCTSGTPAQSVELLAYLASKRIGLVGFAFDLPGTIVQDGSFAPTTYAGFQCGVPGAGPGQILFDDYAAEAQAAAAAPVNGLDGPASWIVSGNGAQGFLSASPGAARLLFNTPVTYVTGTGAADTSQLGLQNAVPTATFTNEVSLAAAINGNQLRPGTVAVQYAPSSPVTPRNQLTDPGDAFLQASLVAHQHGLLLIGAPSLNVVSATAPHLKAIKRTSKFLQRQIAAAAARYSDVFVIQAQSLERTPSRFSAFVRQAAAQAVNAHASVEILTEIRSGAGTGAPTAPMLERDLNGAGSAVSGYDLIDPSSADLTQPATGDAAVGLINSFAGQS